MNAVIFMAIDQDTDFREKAVLKILFFFFLPCFSKYTLED